MELDSTVRAVTDDLRRAGAIGGEETARIAELLVAGLDASLRIHFLEALQAAARELEASVQGITVDVRLDGRDPVLSLVMAAEGVAGAGEGQDLGGFADDELLRLTIRLPEGLKSRVEQAANSAGASINSWIVAALARSFDVPQAAFRQPGRRMPRRVTGFVRG
jgi:hypothetical protein